MCGTHGQWRLLTNIWFSLAKQDVLSLPRTNQGTAWQGRGSLSSFSCSETCIIGHSLGDREEIWSVYALFICDSFSSRRKLWLQMEHGKFELGHVVCRSAAGRLRMRWSGSSPLSPPSPSFPELCHDAVNLIFFSTVLLSLITATCSFQRHVSCLPTESFIFPF